MIFKAGVNTEGVRPPTWYAIGVFEAIYRQFGYRLVVTSLTDGVHPDKKHIHENGFAADLRTRGIPAAIIVEIYDGAKEILFGLGYDIVIERTPDHLHVEWDPKPDRGTWCFVDVEQLPVKGQVSV